MGLFSKKHKNSNIKRVGDEDANTLERYEAFESVMAQVPRGLKIRSVQAREAGNHFAARYNNGKEFYGKTVARAVQQVIQDSPILTERISLWETSIMSDESETTLND